MPRWLQSTLTVLGFLALVGLAFMPRFVEVNVVITDQSVHEHHGPADHGAPALPIVPNGAE